MAPTHDAVSDHCFSHVFNPLNAELNPICYLLALLGAHNFLHVSRIRVNTRNESPLDQRVVQTETTILTGESHDRQRPVSQMTFFFGAIRPSVIWRVTQKTFTSTIAKELTFEIVSDSPASEFYVPTFRDIKFRSQGNRPKEYNKY